MKTASRLRGRPMAFRCAAAFLLLRQRILTGVVIQLFKVSGIAFLHHSQLPVGIHVVFVGVQDADGDVGAVVRGALHAVEQVGPDKAGLHTAFTLLQAGDVPVAQNGLDVVNHLLQRLHIGGGFKIILPQSIHRQCHHIL